MKTTKTDEPDDVTVEEEGEVQYELIAGEDVVGPLCSVM